MKISNIFIGSFLFVLCGCGTYYDPADPYVRGIRSFDQKNFEAAKREWEPLANAGDCDAEYRYGTLYFFGAGVPQDFKAANKWWSNAANQGQAFSQFLLATMYAHDYLEIRTPGMRMSFNCKVQDCGFEKDMPEAYQWARLAERYSPYEDNRGHAKEKAEDFKKSLTAEQLAKADRYVQEWKPSPSQCKQREIL